MQQNLISLLSTFYSLLLGRGVGITTLSGVDGFASVISSILSAMIALAFGFSSVLILGAAVYLIGLIAISRI